ncbi:hypothetical protein SAMN05421847_1817 [Halpernia humi]|uniref:Uncharacterized protein n=1 Tax=Halpernia humi TaxID=493375 RepID=A0A1H5YR12_9FLAO|nr:hypothetical protein SAMN05421847_1817 [Halpernia humi]
MVFFLKNIFVIAANYYTKSSKKLNVVPSK